MYTEKKRTFIVMAVSVLMNLFFFIVAYFLKLPLWLDTTGTVYASVILGFPAGFVVSIVNNTVQAFFFYGAESFNFYLVSAATAFVAGSVMKKHKRKTVLKWILLALHLILLSVTLAVILTFAVNGGVPADYWGRTLYDRFILSWGSAASTVASVSIVKCLDIAVTVVLAAIAYAVTPPVIKYDLYSVKTER